MQHDDYLARIDYDHARTMLHGRIINLGNRGPRRAACF